MSKVNTSFIVLQYKTPEETIECVNSILTNLKEEKNYNIIIVENGSSIECYNKIKEVYGKNKLIDIIRIEKNQGFSKGNNFGFEYAKTKYDPEFYYILSNDTLITQKDTLKIIKEEYKKNKFDVMGPDVVDLLGRHTSPVEYNLSKKGMIKQKIRYTFKYFLVLFYIWDLLEEYFIKKRKTRRENSFGNIKYKEQQEGKGLQGSALIFSKKFFEKVPKPFYPETYLYFEESILNYNCLHFGLKELYSPRLKIIHKEGRTVNTHSKKQRKVELYKTGIAIKSLRILSKYIKKTNAKQSHKSV